jgi:hypothetical protein
MLTWSWVGTPLRSSGNSSMNTTRNYAAREPVSDREQKQMALGYLQEAWSEARLEGIEGDCLAQSALFVAFAELVSTYGEEAAARYAENLGARIRNGEFSIDLSRQ